MKIFAEDDDTKYLYHYTKVSTAIEYILKNRNLSLGSMLNTNDPKESKEWLFELFSTNNNTNLDKYNMDELSKYIGNFIKSSTYMLCFTKDQPLSGNHMLDLVKRGYGHSRMWAQYAEKHTGICLVFEKKALEQSFLESFQNHTCFLQDINYIDRFIGERDHSYLIDVDELENLGLEEYSLAHAEMFKNRLFFEKLEDWKSENEYRFILQGYKEKNLLFPFKNALKGIVFGASCNETDIQEIVNLTHEMSIDYEQLKWRNCSPWYNFNRNYLPTF